MGSEGKCYPSHPLSSLLFQLKSLDLGIGGTRNVKWLKYSDSNFNLVNGVDKAINIDYTYSLDMNFYFVGFFKPHKSFCEIFMIFLWFFKYKFACIVFFTGAEYEGESNVFTFLKVSFIFKHNIDLNLSESLKKI